MAWYACVAEMRYEGIRPVDQARTLGYKLEDGDSLLDALQKSGIPQRRLAEMFGMRKTTVNKWVLNKSIPEGLASVFLREMFPNTPLYKTTSRDPLAFLVELLAEEGLLAAAQATYEERFNVDAPF
jgi:DNA-binding transcriptional regulator YiaG